MTESSTDHVTSAAYGVAAFLILMSFTYLFIACPDHTPIPDVELDAMTTSDASQGTDATPLKWTFTCEEGCVFDSPLAYVDVVEFDDIGGRVVLSRSSCPSPTCEPIVLVGLPSGMSNNPWSGAGGVEHVVTADENEIALLERYASRAAMRARHEALRPQIPASDGVDLAVLAKAVRKALKKNGVKASVRTKRSSQSECLYVGVKAITTPGTNFKINAIADDFDGRITQQKARRNSTINVVTEIVHGVVTPIEGFRYISVETTSTFE